MIQRNGIWILIVRVIRPVMLTRISATGFIIYLFGVPICRRSKAQKGGGVAQADYVEIYEAVNEIHFIYCLLKDMGV
jgi:hypothetical protein